MPKLLNYTTSIAAEKTLGEINHLLATHGARRITADCDPAGNPEAIAFSIETPYACRASGCRRTWRAAEGGWAPVVHLVPRLLQQD